MTIDEIVQKLKTSISIVSVAADNFKLEKKGAKYFMKNPFTKENADSIVIDEDQQTYYSFGDGFGGDIIDFVMIYLNKTFVEAVKYLLNRSSYEMSDEELNVLIHSNCSTKELILRMNKDAAIYFYYALRGKDGKVGLQYFTDKRKLSEDTMKQFGLGFAYNNWNSLIKYLSDKGYSEEEIKNSGLTTVNDAGKVMDKYRNRVIIPIFDINGRVIAFGGRVLDDSKPKYLNSPDTITFDKSKNLYALNIAKNSKRNGFIACEGYMDVIAMHQAGFDNAIASLGTAFTDKQAFLIKTLRDIVYLAYDSDDAGVDATVKAILKLDECGVESRVIDMQPYKDPDEFIKALGADEYQKRIDEAIPSKEFLLKKLYERAKGAEDIEREMQKVAIKIASYVIN